MKQLATMLATAFVSTGMIGCSTTRTLQVNNGPTDSMTGGSYETEPVTIEKQRRETVDTTCTHGVDELVVDMKENGGKVLVSYKCAQNRD